MLKKVVSLFLSVALVLSLISVVWAENIVCAVNDTFNIPDTAGVTGEEIIPGWLVHTIGGGSTIGIRNGALVVDSANTQSTLRRSFSEIKGDKVVVEFLFSIDKITAINSSTDLFSIYDSDYGNSVATVALITDGSNRAFQITSGNGVDFGTILTPVKNFPVYGGDHYFIRFEMNYGETTADQGTFSVKFKNLDLQNTVDFNNLYIKGNGTKFPASAKTFQFMVKGGDTSETSTFMLDDFKIYDATNGYTPEPSLPERVNIVSGLTAASLETGNTDTDTPEKAFDGIISDGSRWLTLGTDLTNYLIMNLDQEKTFDSINVFSGSAASSSLTNFWFEYEKDGAWVQIPGTHFTCVKPTEHNVYLSFAPVTSKRIKLVINEKTAVRLRELKIYQATDPTANISLRSGTGDDSSKVFADMDFYYYKNEALTTNVIAAFYNVDNSIDSVRMIPCSIPGGIGSKPLSFEIAAVPQGTKVKLFYWNGFENIKPLANSASYPIQ